MKLTKMLALLALMGLPAAANAGGDSPAQPNMQVRMPDFQLETTVLRFPTGLTFLIQEDHSHPVAEVFMYVGHGFNDDPVGAEETAHFVEHLWFRSEHGDLPPIMFLIQDLGTAFNATTANDRTDYRTVANTDYLPILLKLESLRLTDFYRGVTEDQIDVEREVIRNEWRRRNEQSTSLVLDYLNEVTYPEDHPYAKRSTHESLDNITLKVLQDYVDTYYKIEDTTITIIGDFKTEEAISMILENFDLSLLHPDLTEEDIVYSVKPGVTPKDPENLQPDEVLAFARNPDDRDADPPDTQWFLWTEGNLPSRLPLQRPEPPEPPEFKELQTRKGPVDKPTVLVGWSMPAGYHEDHFNLIMTGNVAGSYVASGLDRLFDNDVGDAGCFAMPQLHATTVMCYAELNNKKLDADNVAEKMMDQMSKMWGKGEIPLGNGQVINEAQLFNMQMSRSKQETIRDQLNSLDLVAAAFGARGEYIGEFAHWTGDPNYYSRAMRNIMAVQAGEIGKLANKYLRRDRAAVLFVEPLEAEDIDTESDDSGGYAGASDSDAVIESSDDLTRTGRSTIADAYAKPKLEGLIDTRLDNGLRLVVLPHGDTPKVHARVIFGGGQSQGDYGGHQFAANWSESTGHDLLQYAGDPTYYFRASNLGMSTSVAGPLNPRSGIRDTPTDTHWYMGITAPSGNLDSALWTLRAELESVTVDTGGKTSWIKRRRSRMKREWQESDWHMRQMRTEHLFPGGETSTRRTTWEDIDTWESWGSDEVRTYLDDHLHPNNATLLIVGSVTADQAAAHAQKYFGGWTANNASNEAVPSGLSRPAATNSTSRTVIFDDEKRTQTQTTMACRLNVKGEEDREAITVLGSMLGNQVFATLRVKEGLAYSPGGFAFMNDDGSGMLMFQSLAVNKGVGRTVEFFRQAVERVESGNIDMNEVKLHQLRRNRSGNVQSQSVDQMTGRMTDAITAEQSWEDMANRGERISKVRPSDLQRLVEGCLDHAFVSLEGPKDVITEQLDERGYEYELIDYETLGDDLLWKYDPKAAKKKDKAEKKAEKKKKKNGESDEDSGEGEAAETADAGGEESSEG